MTWCHPLQARRARRNQPRVRRSESRPRGGSGTDGHQRRPRQEPTTPRCASTSPSPAIAPETWSCRTQPVPRPAPAVALRHRPRALDRSGGRAAPAGAVARASATWCPEQTFAQPRRALPTALNKRAPSTVPRTRTHDPPEADTRASFASGRSSRVPTSSRLISRSLARLQHQGGRRDETRSHDFAWRAPRLRPVPLSSTQVSRPGSRETCSSPPARPTALSAASCARAPRSPRKGRLWSRPVRCLCDNASRAWARIMDRRAAASRPHQRRSVAAS